MEHQEPLQPAPNPHFHAEEIRSHDQLPRPAQKLLQGRLPVSLRRRLYAVSLQKIELSVSCPCAKVRHSSKS